MASHMERITVAQLSIAVCVIILVHLWYRQQQQANPPPSEAPDPSLARPKKVEGSSSLTRSSRSSLEVLYPGPADPKKVEVEYVLINTHSHD